MDQALRACELFESCHNMLAEGAESIVRTQRQQWGIFENFVTSSKEMTASILWARFGD
jgi:hypothetical protein